MISQVNSLPTMVACLYESLLPEAAAEVTLLLETSVTS
jgi:hypothetical protein